MSLKDSYLQNVIFSHAYLHSRKMQNVQFSNKPELISQVYLYIAQLNKPLTWDDKKGFIDLPKYNYEPFTLMALIGTKPVFAYVHSFNDFYWVGLTSTTQFGNDGNPHYTLGGYYTDKHKLNIVLDKFWDSM